MEHQLYIFDPGTNTSKCPLPTRFEHLLKFVTRIEQYIALHSQEDIININSQLDQTTNLIISNIIQRVIAQVIGKYGPGFVTIEGTAAGALHVSIQEDVPGTKEIKRALIWENTIDNNEIIPLVEAKKICIVNLVFTVDGEADIILNSDANAMSGEMSFGGTNEPKGFVSNHGNFPLKTFLGEAFKIESDTTARIAGYVIYYEEA